KGRCKGNQTRNHVAMGKERTFDNPPWRVVKNHLIRLYQPLRFDKRGILVVNGGWPEHDSGPQTEAMGEGRAGSGGRAVAGRARSAAAVPPIPRRGVPHGRYSAASRLSCER